MKQRLLKPRKPLSEPHPIDPQLAAIFQRYPGERSDVIPILQDIQSVFGYIPRETLAQTARFLKMPEAVVYGVATFYAQFHLTRQGRHKIKCCTGTACHVRGGKRNLAAVRKKLGLEPGGTSPDYEFSLERVACFGSCALAPVMVVDNKVYGTMTPQRAVAIIEKIEEKIERSKDGNRDV